MCVKLIMTKLMKLAGSSWGANANPLRSSVLALCYSVAEYCCPVWQRSTHVSLVDAQLHSSMRLISETPFLVARITVLELKHFSFSSPSNSCQSPYQFCSARLFLHKSVTLAAPSLWKTVIVDKKFLSALSDEVLHKLLSGETANSALSPIMEQPTYRKDAFHRPTMQAHNSSS